MNSPTAPTPVWFQDCIARAKQEIDSHADGLLDRTLRTRIWFTFYRNSTHAHFRRGFAYLLTGCSVVPQWIGDPHVADEHRNLVVAGLEVCRSLLLDRETSKTLRESLQWRLDEEANKVFLSARETNDTVPRIDRRSSPLAIVAACIHHIPSLPLIDDLDVGYEDAEHLFPESLACMHETSYPLDGQWDATAVRRYWHWWIDRIVKDSIGSVDDMLETVRTLSFTREDLRPFAFDANR